MSDAYPAGEPDVRLKRAYDPARFAEFRRRYLEELAARAEKLGELRGRARKGTVTLVYAARDDRHNDAVVLAELLRGHR